ncbi:MAG: MBL fold metallo-hydrolase [Gammaproteobacteria bacterium]|nr:MBL fold metallo-hydrolase [Gammaproteobacteria bacterium]
MKSLGIALALVAVAVAAAPAGAQGERREITRIAGDLYRFQNNNHFSVFLVTPEGVIATDPIDPAAAAWLEQEIENRFAQPIRYLVYSHDHRDHIAGGEVFADTATVVAHDNARRTIIAEKRPTAVPDLTFSERMTITLGGKSVELVYLGRNHSDNSIVMRFPEERALFAVDFISVKRLPYRDLSDSYFPDWIESVKRVEAMDFDIFVPGHGELGTRADVSDHRRYLEALYEGVLAAAREGKPLDQIKSELLLEEFSHFGQYDAWRELNIEGVHRQVVLHRRGN